MGRKLLGQGAHLLCAEVIGRASTGIDLSAASNLKILCAVVVECFSFTFVRCIVARKVSTSFLLSQTVKNKITVYNIYTRFFGAPATPRACARVFDKSPLTSPPDSFYIAKRPTLNTGRYRSKRCH